MLYKIMQKVVVSYKYVLKYLVMQNDPDFEPCIVALARISAAKPYSMDVERIVSSYNLIKSTDCSLLSGDTLQDYLVVRMMYP